MLLLRLDEGIYGWIYNIIMKFLFKRSILQSPPNKDSIKNLREANHIQSWSHTYLEYLGKTKKFSQVPDPSLQKTESIINSKSYWYMWDLFCVLLSKVGKGEINNTNYYVNLKLPQQHIQLVEAEI